MFYEQLYTAYANFMHEVTRSKMYITAHVNMQGCTFLACLLNISLILQLLNVHICNDFAFVRFI